MPIKEGKVVIIGAGMVGAATLSAVLMMNLISEVVLIDRDEDRAHGEALDASHTTAFAYSSNASIRAGGYEDCIDAAIIVMTAGPSFKPGEELDRLLLANKNTAVTTQVMEQVTRYTREAILITVTNPVDIVTYCAQARFEYPPERVIGTGTLLDTARLRQMLARQCDVDGKNVHGYVLGEHGESAFIPWGTVDVCGVPFDALRSAFGLASAPDRGELLERTKSVGLDIVELKGYTSSGVAMAVSRLIKAVLLNEHSVLPVSTVQRGAHGVHGVALSLPSVITREGIKRVVELPLHDEDIGRLNDCVRQLNQVLHETGLKQRA